MQGRADAVEDCKELLEAIKNKNKTTLATLLYSLITNFSLNSAHR